MLKLDLGTIKIESAASDLPPTGPPKERWVELSRISMIWRPAYLDSSILACRSRRICHLNFDFSMPNSKIEVRWPPNH